MASVDRRCTALLGLLPSLCLGPLATAAPVVVKVESTEQGWQLLRGGQPYRILGAGGHQHLKRLADLGGNSVRTWGADNLGPLLDEAHQHGLTVTVGLWLGHKRHGFDYNNADHVAEQYEKSRKAVLAYRDHPALLLWGVGNEMEGFGEGDDAAVWSAVNNIASMIKRLDPHHPTMTVTAEIGGQRVANVHRLCPDIDIMGVNSYGGAKSLPTRYTAAGGTKPLLVTEFGPDGAWASSKTDWGRPIEAPSMVKAGQYAARYRALERAPFVLGSYAFLWGHKREGTATWFGLFLPDGSPLEGVEVLGQLWRGESSAPVKRHRILGLSSDRGPVVDPNESFRVKAQLLGSGGHLSWVLEKEPAQYSEGGDREADPPPVAAELTPSRSQVRVQAPKTPGAYRLYAYLRSKRGASTANFPFLVRGEIQASPSAGAFPVQVLGSEHWVPSGYMGATKAISMHPFEDGKRRGISVVYDRPDQWGGVVWQHPADDWGSQDGGFDLRGARKLSFWVKGERGGETVKFGYGLLKRDRAFFDSSGTEIERKLPRTWKKMEIRLGSADLSRIKTPFFWVVEGQGGPVRFYLSDIRFEE